MPGSLLDLARESALARSAPAPAAAAPELPPPPSLGNATREENLLYDADGNAVAVADPTAAFAAGALHADRTRRYNVTDGKGNTFSVAGADLPHALGTGMRLESTDATALRERLRLHEERGGLGQQALAGVEGLGRGLTLGLSDAALAKLKGPEYAQAAKERMQANPVTAGATELVGAVAPALIPGGAEAEGANLAARGGLAGRGLALAREGAALTPAALVARAGSAVERGVSAGARALGYEGESALARMALQGAKLGTAGAVQGGLYGAGQAFSSAALDGEPITAEKVVASMGHGAMLGFGTGAALGVVGEGISTAASKALKAVRGQARVLADESALKAIGARGSDLRRLGKNAEKANQEIGEIGQELLSYQFKTGPKAGQKLFQTASKAEDFVADLALARKETGAALGSLRGEIDDAIAANPELAPDVRSYLKDIETEVLTPLRGSKSPTVRARADRVEAELSGLAERTNAANPGEPLTFAELDQFRRDLRSVFQPAKPTGGGLPAPVPEHAQHLERAERMLSDQLDASAESALAKMGRDPAEYSRLKEQFRNIRQAQDIADKASLQDLGNRAISPSDYATGIASGMAGLMSGHIGALAFGAAGTVAHKLIRERGRSVIALMADKVARYESELAASVPRILEIGSSKAVPTTISFEREAERVADAVREYQGDQRAAVARLAAPVKHLAPEYPQLASAVQNQLANTYQFLGTKLPAPITRAPASLTPQLEPVRYDPAKVKQFARFARGALAPQAVVRDLADGKLDRDGLEALKAVHPETFAQLRTNVMREVGKLTKPLPFQRRVLLSLVLDFPADRSFEPGFAADIQAAHAAQQAAEAQKAAAHSANLSDRLATSMAPATQKLAGGM